MGNFNRSSRSNSRGGGNFGRPEMYKAVCDECGKTCEVPFKPTGNKPIFCSDCFAKKNEGKDRSDSKRDRHDNSRRGSRDFNRSGSREREMYQAVCDECGKTCEVPFKPSNDKPIFCSDCFAKKNEGRERSPRGDSRSRGSNQDGQYEKEFQAINEKLDKILQSLFPTSVKKVVVKAKIKTKTKKVASAKGGSAFGGKKKVSKLSSARKKPVKKVEKKKVVKKKPAKKKVTPRKKK